MRLIKIKLAGFKSFVEPTTILIPSNLIGVVGPNGCGKSNVIDAVRWVMGESSAKHLRGDSMSDVIFNGSTARKPVGMATIELIFDNSEGKLGGQYEQYNEIAIKRQVSRDAVSHYYLNGSRCRRRDITDIFLGTGLGPRSYSIIEQGMISRIVEAKPDDLRQFLEEAAGVSKYRDRRRDTENRIRHSRENLLRLDDLIEEISKQLMTLKRQATVAEKYKSLKQEERGCKTDLLCLKWNDLNTIAESQGREITEIETTFEEKIAAQRALESAIEKQRVVQYEASEAFNRVQSQFYETGAEISKVEQEIEHIKELTRRHELELTQLAQSEKDLQHQKQQDETSLVEIHNQLERLEEEIRAGSVRLQAADAELQELEQTAQIHQNEWAEHRRTHNEVIKGRELAEAKIGHLSAQIDQNTQRENVLKTHLESNKIEFININISKLEKSIDDLDGFTINQQDGLKKNTTELQSLKEKAILCDRNLHQARQSFQEVKGKISSLEALTSAESSADGRQINEWLEQHSLSKCPRLAKEIRVNQGWEHAVETVLGLRLGGLLVENTDKTIQSLEDIQAGNIHLWQAGGTTDKKSGRLSSQVESPVDLSPWLSNIHIADSLEQAKKIADKLPKNESVITPTGVWMGHAWISASKQADNSAGLLLRERDLRNAKKAIKLGSEKIQALENERERLSENIQSLDKVLQSLQADLNQTHRQLSEKRALLEADKQNLKNEIRRQQEITTERAELEHTHTLAIESLGKQQKLIQQASAQIEALVGQEKALGTKQEHVNEALAKARDVVNQERQQQHALALQRESKSALITAMQQHTARLETQLLQIGNRKKDLIENHTKTDNPVETLQNKLETYLKKRLEVETALSTARKTVEQSDAELRNQERERLSLERDATEIRSTLELSRLQNKETRVRRQSIEEQLAELKIDLSDQLSQLDDAAKIDELEAKSIRLGQQIERLGPINLAAIEEFDKQSERKQYLDQQKADLEEALATLEEAIRKIDRETRTRFKDTFDQVNQNFQKLFPKLFAGGHAYLELTGENLLDTGVGIMARPPGKRNSTIHLLSGGEKALTAVALVFSIFELNPAPFCMLDEVDAPLDDANVGRFCEMVKGMSNDIQFVFITHNKATMEMANQLIGITMQEPGVSRMVSVDVDRAIEMAAS